MTKTRITISITVDSFAYAGGGYDDNNILAFETAIEDALDASMTDYDTVVHITMGKNDAVTDISGLDPRDDQDNAVRDLIVARLNDVWFMNAAWEKSWR